MYYKNAYGLRFHSEVDWIFPQGEASSDTSVDVNVSFRSGEPMEAIVREPRIEITPRKLFMKTSTIADYVVEDGSHIFISPKIGADRLKIINLLFGAATGAILVQRGILALHGCSVETPRGAAIFCGRSGAGKSTLAALLLNRGMRILDDNISALDFRSDKFLVHPGLGYLRLTQHTYDIIGRKPSGDAYAAPREVKYLFPLKLKSFCSLSRPVTQIFLLDRGSPQMITPIMGSLKLATIQAHTFVSHFIQNSGQGPKHFERCVSLARHVPITLLGYPLGLKNEFWVSRIVEHLNNFC